MATRSPASLAHLPDVGSGSAWASKEDQLADLHRRLSEALDRADLFSAYVDPRLVVELRDLLGEVLEAAGEQPGCRYRCRATPFHCPVTDPLEKVMARLQAAGWFPCWGAVQDQAARELACLCGTPMTFQALCADGGQAIAWAVCTFCGHWRLIPPSDQT